jgi:hypothetical protein
MATTTETTPKAASTPKKRLHHFLFTHRALPEIFLRDPYRRFSLIAQRNGREFLEIFWRFVGDDLEHGERLSADELSRSIHSLNNNEWIIAVVKMPDPIAAPEAWFAALALRPPSKKGPAGGGGLMAKLLARRRGGSEAETADPRARAAAAEPPARYFTLEREEDETTGETRSVYIEWNRKGKRRQLARGLEASETAFVRAVADTLLGP